MNLHKTLGLALIVATGLLASPLSFAGKDCPARGCSGADEPNGSSLHGIALEAPAKACTSRGCGSNDEPNGVSEHGAS